MATPAEQPRVWILWRRRQGDLDQMTVLAKALGWPFEVKRLSFYPPNIPALANILLKSASDSLDRPWPDLVICAEALPSIVARRLRERSGGLIKTLCLARPAGSASAFDLVITTAQYRIPPAANVLELDLPLSDGSAPHEASSSTSATPRIVLVTGSSSFPERLDAGVAETMVREVQQHAASLGGIMVCITSPRTGGGVVQALRRAVSAPHELHLYGKGRTNPYRQLLADAGEIIVTSDSVSMVGDALETGKPVFIYPLPRARHVQWQVSEWLYRQAVLKQSPLLGPVRRAFDAGVLEVGADRRLLFDRLANAGRVAWFGQPAATPQPDLAKRQLERAVARVRALFGMKPQDGSQ